MNEEFTNSATPSMLQTNFEIARAVKEDDYTTAKYGWYLGGEEPLAVCRIFRLKNYKSRNDGLTHDTRGIDHYDLGDVMMYVPKDNKWITGSAEDNLIKKVNSSSCSLFDIAETPDFFEQATRVLFPSKIGHLIQDKSPASSCDPT